MEAILQQKICNGCETLKPFSDYYHRSGTDGSMPGHYVSECKECMRERSRSQKYLSKLVPRTEHETIAIDYLKQNGIHATPGKAQSYADVDVMAWGAVRIEVKLGVPHKLADGEAYLFNTSSKQQQRGLLADVVMLIVPWADDDLTFHLFLVDYKPFYKPGTTDLKSAFYYRPGAIEPQRGVIKSYADEALDHFITEDDMQDAQDRVGLIWREVKRISQELQAS